MIWHKEMLRSWLAQSRGPGASYGLGPRLYGGLRFRARNLEIPLVKIIDFSIHSDPNSSASISEVRPPAHRFEDPNPTDVLMFQLQGAPLSHWKATVQFEYNLHSKAQRPRTAGNMQSSWL